MQGDNLGTLVTYNPASIGVDETLDDVVERLLGTSYHHWPVIDSEHRVVGVISDDNIVRALAQTQALQLAGVGGDDSQIMSQGAIPVSQIMSPRALTIERDSPPQAALQMLIEHRIHSLPVVQEGELVGIVTSTDFLREISYGERDAYRLPVSRHMTKTDEAVEATATLDDAREAMMLAGLKYLPVIKGECPLGIVAERALRRAKCQEFALARTSARDDCAPRTVIDLVKTAPTIKPGEKLCRAASLMVDHGVRAVAVVNQASRLLGLISEDALLAAAAQ